jgi:hypothetical protein
MVASPNLLWYSTQQIGETREKTPEGYLICKDVPIARIGAMIYARDEIPLTADSSGLIHVNRTEDEVFRPETLASFNGKPVVISHPEQMVTPKTWKKHAVGHAMHVRRGEGRLRDYMVADLLIMHDEGIEAIEMRGLRQISNGYEAGYRQIQPGVGEQYNILGNHIALVDNARCGPTCAIGDSNDRVIEVTEKGTQRMPTLAENIARLETAWRTNDRATLDQVMGEMTGARPDTLPSPSDQKPGTGAPAPTDGNAHRIIVNVHGGGAGDTPTTPVSAAPVPPPPAAGAPVQPITGAVSPAAVGGIGADPAVMAILQQILAALNGDDTDDDADNDGPPAADNSDGEGADPDPPNVRTNDAPVPEPKPRVVPKVTPPAKPAVTTDSSTLASTFQDVMARAEILCPGVQVPSFDSAAASTATENSMCETMRRALTGGYANDQTRAVITPLLLGKTVDFGKITCDSVTSFFMAASEMKKMANQKAVQPKTVPTADSGTRQAPPTAAELNAKNAVFWAQNGNK